MKVLFIPHPMPAHLIPLISLAKMLNNQEFEIAFLVKEKLHAFIEGKGFSHLNIDRRDEDKLFSEMRAISVFEPDVIVDDLNYFSTFSCNLYNISRVSIVRKGILPFESYNPRFKHSSDVVRYFDSLDKIDFSEYGMEQPESVADLFRGAVNIIPSIPSVEELPEELKKDKSYIYSGPLLLGDDEMLGDQFPETVLHAVENFLEKNENKKIVYLDMGMAQPEIITQRIGECIQILFDHPEVVVVTNYVGYACSTENESRFFAADFVPGNLICSRADLIVHKCGSGSYNHQLNSETPAIILGSNCYDRDEIAIRLDELGAAKYISPDLEPALYFEKFGKSVIGLLGLSGDEQSKQKSALAKIKEEIRETQNQFDFEKVLESAMTISHPN